MTDLIAAFGLALVLEGVVYALFPAGMQRLLVLLVAEPPNRVRAAGLVAAVVGLGIVWLARG